MLGSRHENAHLQSDFYREKFRKVLHWLTMSVLIVLMLLLVIFYLILFKPSSAYYANTTSGRILDMPRPVS